MSHSYVKEINNKILKTGGSSGGETGSPGDDYITCTRCHDNNPIFSLTSSITTNIPPTGYVLGQTYSITISTESIDAKSWGFELTAEEDDTNLKVGVFDIIDSTGSPKLILGTSAVTNSNATSNSWSFNWTAPTTNKGPITFYAAVLAGDGNEKKIGDQTITASATTNSNTLSIRNENMFVFDLYPNPSQDFLTILLPNEIATGSINLFDYSGKSIKSKQINSNNNTLDISRLSQGLYFIKLNSEGKTGIKKVIKR